MKLSTIKDPQKRDRFFARAWKSTASYFRQPCKSVPVFVFGAQRSGTTMLMYAFHRHPQTAVFDEHHDNRVYFDHRIRSFRGVAEEIENSRFPFVCFKPICDSHLINEFVSNFPQAHHIWIYRDFRDVANSRLRKFPNPIRAITLVCKDQPGGGWFDEGISDRSRKILQEIYDPALSDFDLSCLCWWARNRIILESDLLRSEQVTLLKYEELVKNGRDCFEWLFTRIEMPFSPRVCYRISDRSIRRHPTPSVHPDVFNICTDLQQQLDDAFYSYSDLP